MAFPTIPVLLGAGVIGLVLLTRKTETPSTPIPPQPPSPVPQNLLQQMANFIAQARANPQSVNADQMDVLANQLEANGNISEALMLRAWASSVRLSQQAIPRPPPVREAGPLLTQMNQLLTQASNPQSQIVVDEMDRLANVLYQQGLSTQANELRAAADKARLERDPLPCLNPPCPYGPVKRPQPVFNTNGFNPPVNFR